MLDALAEQQILVHGVAVDDHDAGQILGKILAPFGIIFKDLDVQTGLLEDLGEIKADLAAAEDHYGARLAGNHAQVLQQPCRNRRRRDKGYLIAHPQGEIARGDIQLAVTLDKRKPDAAL